MDWQGWAAIIVPSLLGSEVLGVMRLYILRYPRVSAKPIGARWHYRYRGGTDKTGISVFATVYLTNNGDRATDVVGYFIIPGTHFTAANLLPTGSVERVPEQRARQAARYDGVIPIATVNDRGETMVIPLTLRLFPMGQRRFYVIGKEYIDVAYEARFTSGIDDVF